MSKDELAQQTLELILAGHNLEVIALLNDATLLKFSEPLFYLRRGLAYKRLEEFDKALADYDIALELRPGYADAYHNRGILLDLMGEYDKAIADFTKSIEIKPDDESYNCRGNSWDNKREFERAIADYTKAIEMNPGHVHAHNNLGIAWDNKGDYERALLWFNKAIGLDPTDPLPYLNRGAVYEHMNEPEKGLQDYNKALQLKPDFSHAYAQIGTLLTAQKKYSEAISYYDLACKYAPHSKNFQRLLDEAKAKLGEAVEVNSKSDSFSARYVESAITALSEDEKKPIRIACAKINEQITAIRQLIVYKGNESVVHYTQLKTADILVTNRDAKLRYSNVVFMNDPEEGKVLIEHLLPATIKNAFELGKLKEDNNIYLGSFLPEDKADYLVMWRTYGKNELNEEAAGCSITIKRTFFDYEDRGLYADMRPTDIDPTEKQALYHVLYYDKKKKALIADGNEFLITQISTCITNLQKELEGLISLKEPQDIADDSTKNSAINKFVFRYVSELCYFFKSADYHFEKELRVIKYYMPHDSNVKVDMSTAILPRKLYIESTQKARPYIAGVILGPKVPHPERWTYLDAVMKQAGLEIALEASKCKFQ